MNTNNRLLVAAVLAMCVSPMAFAQASPEAREAVQREAEQAQRQAEEAQQEAERAQTRAEQALRAAEARLQEAAQEVARLSRARAPEAVVIREEFLARASRPRLGLSLATEEYTDDSGRKEESGIKILGVSPGSAADEAGVKAGDVLIGFAGETLDTERAGEAVERIAEKLKDAEVGDSYTLRVERDGKAQDLELTLNDASFGPNVFAFSSGDGQFDFRVMERERMRELQAREMAERAMVLGERGMQNAERFLFLSSNSPWSSMELVELTPRLGKYFKAEEGLLVVRAPSDAGLGFEDGDVIREIGGRKPTDVGHAMRILRSYGQGEKLEVAIVRDGRRRKLDIEVPETVGANVEPKIWSWGFGSQAPEAPEPPEAPRPAR